MVIIPGSTSLALAKSVSGMLDVPMVIPCVSRFADGEINLEVPTGVATGSGHIVLMQSLSAPASDNLIELMLLTDAVRRTLAPQRITAVIPYLCYSRQDRVMQRVDSQETFTSALSAKVVARILSTSGLDHIVTLDLHSQQAAGFFDVPFTNISAYDVFVDYLSGSNLLERLVIVSPDYGALGRVRAFVRMLSSRYNMNSIQVAVIDKYREGPGISEVMHVVGNVQDRHCFILDDIVDSGGTLCNAAAALKTRGAISVHSFITHGVLSGRAIDAIGTAELDSLVITDTIHNPDRVNLPEKIKVLSVDRLLSNYLLSHTVWRKN
ncbi:ribose-phosphate diphosphokinase family protein [Anaplasma phagocytophilum str. ApNP]|uniref:ribose-phosphate diphosphokinase n=1 Tax=Anaplasma phagocytophilum str. ApNP TaxID=1359153 RepID=A0A0F3NGG5_ANAPH|nr:ribose-phosphate diphosphokinase family protein [Anaplasma phagocytophilum str. ApNP]